MPVLRKINAPAKARTPKDRNKGHKLVTTLETNATVVVPIFVTTARTSVSI